MRKKHLKTAVADLRASLVNSQDDLAYVIKERDELAVSLAEKEEELVAAYAVEADLRAQITAQKKEINALKKSAKVSGEVVKKVAAKKVTTK